MEHPSQSPCLTDDAMDDSLFVVLYIQLSFLVYQVTFLPTQQPVVLFYREAAAMSFSCSYNQHNQGPLFVGLKIVLKQNSVRCLLYTSDAADE